MPLISLTGRIGSGKSLVARILAELGYREYALASPLKEIAVTFGFNPQHVNGTQEDKLIVDPDWGCSSREWLQKFGTEVCRETFPVLFPNSNFPHGIWSFLMKKEYQRQLAINPNYCMCVSDNRFLNEAVCIKEMGGYIIKLVANTNNKYQSSHKSEIEIDSIEADFLIINHRGVSIRYLITQIVKILRHIDPERHGLDQSKYRNETDDFIIEYLTKYITSIIDPVRPRPPKPYRYTELSSEDLPMLFGDMPYDPVEMPIYPHVSLDSDYLDEQHDGEQHIESCSEENYSSDDSCSDDSNEDNDVNCIIL